MNGWFKIPKNRRIVSSSTLSILLYRRIDRYSDRG